MNTGLKEFEYKIIPRCIHSEYKSVIYPEHKSKHKHIVLRGKNKEVARHEVMSKTLAERLEYMEKKLEKLDDLKGKWYLIYRKQFIYEITLLFL